MSLLYKKYQFGGITRPADLAREAAEYVLQQESKKSKNNPKSSNSTSNKKSDSSASTTFNLPQGKIETSNPELDGGWKLIEDFDRNWDYKISRDGKTLVTRRKGTTGNWIDISDNIKAWNKIVNSKQVQRADWNKQVEQSSSSNLPAVLPVAGGASEVKSKVKEARQKSNTTFNFTDSTTKTTPQEGFAQKDNLDKPSFGPESRNKEGYIKPEYSNMYELQLKGADPDEVNEFISSGQSKYAKYLIMNPAQLPAGVQTYRIRAEFLKEFNAWKQNKSK